MRLEFYIDPSDGFSPDYPVRIQQFLRESDLKPEVVHKGGTHEIIRLDDNPHNILMGMAQLYCEYFHENMMEDYDDAQLVAELRKRGYSVVPRNNDMEFI